MPYTPTGEYDEDYSPSNDPNYKPFYQPATIETIKSIIGEAAYKYLHSKKLKSDADSFFDNLHIVKSEEERKALVEMLEKDKFWCK